MVCHVEFNTFLSHLKKLFGWISFSNQSNHDVSSPEIKVEKCESHFHPRVNCYCNMKNCWYVLLIRQKAQKQWMAWPGFQGKCPPLKKCANMYFRIVNSGQCFFTLDFIPIPTLISWLVLTLYLVAFVYLTTQIENIQINFSYKDEYNKDQVSIG